MELSPTAADLLTLILIRCTLANGATFLHLRGLVLEVLDCFFSRRRRHICITQFSEVSFTEFHTEPQ